MARGLDFNKAPEWGDLRCSKYVDAGLLKFGVSLADLENNCGALLAYLATPYSLEVVDGCGDHNPALSRRMGDAAAYWAGTLVARGVNVTSPIIQSDAMFDAVGRDIIDPLDNNFWAGWCSLILLNTQRLIVPPIHGWHNSAGIFAEVMWTLESNRAVYIMGNL